VPHANIDPEMMTTAFLGTASMIGNNQQLRLRALVVPREHGAWGLLLVPLLTGAITGLFPGGRLWPTSLLGLAAVLLFWSRTPAESLIGSGAMVAHTREERRLAFLVVAPLILISVVCLMALLWGGRNLKLVPIGGFSALAFLAQTFLRRLHRSLRMASQMIGVFGLTAAAPAAYYVASGRLGLPALVLWAANSFFAADQIHFVQLRIHACRAGTRKEKIFEGRYFLAGQASLLLLLAAGLVTHIVSPLIALAFVPALFRGTRWFFQAPEALNVRALGWSEMRQGVAFGVLLTFALLIH
jgi:hypothetical protein